MNDAWPPRRHHLFARHLEQAQAGAADEFESGQVEHQIVDPAGEARDQLALQFRRRGGVETAGEFDGDRAGVSGRRCLFGFGFRVAYQFLGSVCWFWFCFSKWISGRPDRPTPLGQAQNVFARFAPVLNLIQCNGGPVGCPSRRAASSASACGLRAGGGGRVERRAAIAQFDDERRRRCVRW